MKKPELLSPAGSMESLKAAIQGGCDAVYLSGNLYGARSYAANFTNDELKEAVALAHLYGVKVYVTVNTLIYEAEVKNFLSYIEFLTTISVDALIIQDIGMMDLLHQRYPRLELHASTQMHIHNLEGVKLLEDLGIKRVVLARETPIELVREIKQQTSLEIEIFVHGALCISYSGQCLMSSLIGGRSGNRGTCAQCCRQPYQLEVEGTIRNKEKYLLSAKDLNTLEYLPQLIDGGIDSLKIEGRMKRPEYVYLITSLYRKAIDSYCLYGKIVVTEEELQEMKKIFHRGFTKGFLFHEENSQFTNEYRPNHMGIPIGTVVSKNTSSVDIKLSQSLTVRDGIRILGKEDTGKEIDVIYLGKKKVPSARKGDIVRIPYQDPVAIGSVVVKTTDWKQLERLQQEIQSEPRKVNLTFTFSARIGEKCSLQASDGINCVVAESDYVVEASQKAPLSKDKIQNQLMKLGGTVYQIQTINWDMDENIFIPVQKMNELRRSVVEKISEKRLYTLDYGKSNYNRKVPHFPIVREKTVYVTTQEEYEKIKKKEYQEIYMDSSLYEKISDPRKVLKLPRVQEHLKPHSERLLVGELGSIYCYSGTTSDFSFNVVNSYSVALLHCLGVRKVTLSYELSDHQIENIIRAYQNRYQEHPYLEIIGSGRIEAMISKYRLLTKYGISSSKAFLVDKFSNHFPVEEKEGLTYIYHYQKKQERDYNSYYEMGIMSIRDSF